MLVNELKFPANSGVVFYVARSGFNPNGNDVADYYYAAVYPDGSEFRLSSTNYLALRRAFIRITCSDKINHDTDEVRWFIYDTDLKAGFIMVGDLRYKMRPNSDPQRSLDQVFSYNQTDKDIGERCKIPPSKESQYYHLVRNADTELVGGIIHHPKHDVRQREWTRLIPSLRRMLTPRPGEAHWAGVLEYEVQFDDCGIDLIPLCTRDHSDVLRYMQVQDVVTKELSHIAEDEDSNTIRWGERFLLRCLPEVEGSAHIRFQLILLRREPTRITYKELFS